MGSAPGRSSPARRAGSWAAALVGVAVVVGAGAWGVRAMDSAPVPVGAELSHDGGTAVVLDAWTLSDPMTLMHPDDPQRYAATGMRMMSSMLSDPVPAGYKRVAIELALQSGETRMQFPHGRARLVADGVSHAPYSALLGDELLEPGTALSGVVVFEVPEEAGPARFVLGDGAQPVMVDVTGTTSSDHGGGHGGE